MRTLPTLRDKKRYIAFEIAIEQPVTRQELTREILNSTHSLFGDAGCSNINPSLLSFEGRCGILRCSREKTKEARAALACVNSIHGNKVSIFVLGISGTIKGTEKFIQQPLNKELEPKKE
jgi:ribonuclease P/MRP protein subunit POP5